MGNNCCCEVKPTNENVVVQDRTGKDGQQDSMYPTDNKSVQLSEESASFVKRLAEQGMNVEVVLQTGNSLSCEIRWETRPTEGHTIVITNSEKSRPLPVSTITEVLFTPEQLERIYNIRGIRDDDRCTGLVMHSPAGKGGDASFQCIPLRWPTREAALKFVNLLHSIEPKLAEVDEY